MSTLINNYTVKVHLPTAYVLVTCQLIFCKLKNTYGMVPKMGQVFQYYLYTSTTKMYTCISYNNHNNKKNIE
jgi:hypothetical protein